MKGNIFTVSDKNRRISSIGKEAPVICSIIIQKSQQFRVVYSSFGYGFLWNNPAPGRCETTNNHTMWVADSAYQADYLIYAGETPADVLKNILRFDGICP